MRILRIAFNIPPHIGGMEKHIYFLTQKQKERGIEVDVIYSIGEDIGESDKKIKAPILRPQSIRDFFFCIQIAYYLLRSKNKYDVVHLHGDWSLFVWGYLFKRIVGAARLVGTNHAAIYPGMRKKLLAVSIRNYDTMYYTGYEAYSIMSGITQSVFQPSGINPLFFNLAESDSEKDIDVITTAYRRPEKNLKTVVEIARKLPGCSFVLIGSGPETDMLKNLVDTYNLKNIILMDAMPVEDVINYLKRSRVFLLTSLLEGTPTSIMEAMSIGLPIVSSDVCGISQTVKQATNGYMISNPYDIDKYCNAIKSILNDKDIYQKMADANERASIHFNWDEIEKNITYNYRFNENSSGN